MLYTDVVDLQARAARLIHAYSFAVKPRIFRSSTIANTVDSFVPS